MPGAISLLDVTLTSVLNLRYAILCLRFNFGSSELQARRFKASYDF